MSQSLNTIGSLFSGIGGLEMGLEWATGARTLFQVEQDQYCRSVLKKHWPNACRKITDVKNITADNVPAVDILCGGFPCQDISTCGSGEGINGKKSKLWFEFDRIIRDIRPGYVVLENVPALTTRGLGVVLGSLAAIGYNAQWGVLSAAAVGAPHLRRRIFIIGKMANANSKQRQTRRIPIGIQEEQLEPNSIRDSVANANSIRLPGPGQPIDASNTTQNRKRKTNKLVNVRIGDHWKTEPGLGRVANGVPNRSHRLRALGNAVVPQVSYQVGLRLVNYAREVTL
tara:strand:+ start:35 stop:889 length:855 start_codon:yes stop_codon:yes gene_type:complete